MRLPRLTLKQRLVIALAAIAAIHFAFYVTPRYLATRPHFDEAAYSDAVTALKEEVGAPAVESGAFSIPRAPVSCPYRGEAIIADTSWGLFLDIDGDCARLLSCATPEGFPKDQPRAKMAVISRQRARQIWSAISLLRMTRARGSANAVQTSSPPTLKLADRTWPSAHIERSDWASSDVNQLERDVICRAAGRYAQDLGASEDLAWTADRAALERAMIATLSRSVRRPDPDGEARDFANDLWMTSAERFLASFASAKAAPFFRAALRRSHAYDRLPPLIRRVLGLSANRPVTNFPWIWEKLAGKSPAEQLAAASSAAFDPKSPDKDQCYVAIWFLFANRPDELRRLCIEHYEDQGPARNWPIFNVYAEAFPGDTSLIDFISRKPGFDDEATALGWAYQVTKKREYLDALMQYALRPPDWFMKSSIPATPQLMSVYARNKGLANPFAAASEQLMGIYINDRSLTAIPEFLLAHSALATPGSLTRVLAARGSPEDRQFLASVALDEVPEYSALPKKVAEGRRWEAIGAFQVNRNLLDESVINRFVEYLESEPEPFAAESQYVKGIMRLLGGVKSEKAHEFIEKIWAQDDHAPEHHGAISYVTLYNISRTDNDRLRTTLFSLRMRCAASPVDALHEIVSREGDLPQCYYVLAYALADEYSEADLERFLAEARYTSIRGYIYAALVMKREGEVRR